MTEEAPDIKKLEDRFQRFRISGSPDVIIEGDIFHGYAVNVPRCGGTESTGEVTGACCFEDGTCSVETAAQCSTDGGTYQGDGTLCDPNPCTICLVSLSCAVGCAGGSVGQPSEDDAWAMALSDWMDCIVQPFSCSDGFCFSVANPRSSSIATETSATINTCGTKFTLDGSTSGFANVSGVLRTYDDLMGLVDETPFSFTLTGIGDSMIVTPTPFEPADPGPFPASNHTFTNIEDVVLNCA